MPWRRRATFAQLHILPSHAEQNQDCSSLRINRPHNQEVPPQPPPEHDECDARGAGRHYPIQQGCDGHKVLVVSAAEDHQGDDRSGLERESRALSVIA